MPPVLATSLKSDLARTGKYDSSLIIEKQTQIFEIATILYTGPYSLARFEHQRGLFAQGFCQTELDWHPKIHLRYQWFGVSACSNSICFSKQ